LKLLDIIHRQKNPAPWSEGDNIPWNDPEFSKRMLNEHLSQNHDAASRRSGIINNHVSWIHNRVLKRKPSRILDIGCGPGLYTNRLAGLGHQCTGIDFSPASIAYAKEQAEKKGCDCSYMLHDIRTAEYGKNYSLVLSIYGEFNVFKPSDAKKILAKAYEALAEDGMLLLEPHTFEATYNFKDNKASWQSHESGLFSDKPHLCLEEHLWNSKNRASISRYYIIDAGTGEVTCSSSSYQAYTQDEYKSLLAECGFGKIRFFQSIGNSKDTMTKGLMCILARKT
jgi:SAM-dependent methyltransferase